MMKPPTDSGELLSAARWRTRAKEILTQRFSEPSARFLVGAGFTPNRVTIAGGLLGIAAGYMASKGHLFEAGVLVIASGALDLIDGAMARLTGQKTRFGALLDSTMDRLGEAAILFGLLALYSDLRSTPMVLLVFATMVGSVLVSYIKARAEGLGLQCDVGVLTRGERVVLLALGLILNQVPITLWVLAILSYVTAAQRLWHVRRAPQDQS